MKSALKSIMHLIMGLMVLGIAQLHVLIPSIQAADINQRAIFDMNTDKKNNDELSCVEQKKSKKKAAAKKRAALRRSVRRKGRRKTKPVQQPPVELVQEPFATHTLFIFLDDTEMVFGAVSQTLASALLQEAGPIIVSASLCVNINSSEIGKEDPELLLQTFNSINEKWKKPGATIHDESYPHELKERTRIFCLAAGLDAETAATKWIIKEISPRLYLFLPKKYVHAKKISAESVEDDTFMGLDQVTPTEQVLGLKVNHMKTVTLDTIQRPDQPPGGLSDYFIDLLNDIFVVNSEYPINNKAAIPTWAFWATGHGHMHHKIIGLPLPKFQMWLEFLNTKLNTKLLYYWSCYASGVNAEELYEDSKTSLYETYPFVLITQALTDTPAATYAWDDLYIDQGKLSLKKSHDYTNFVDMVTSSDTLDYRALVEPFAASLRWLKLGSSPQIKFPGIPWFSVIHIDKVVSVGSIMAKARTEPLDVAHFFKQGNGLVSLLGILLYAQDVPFELVINTKSADEYYVPTFVSMIPGNVVHHIKRISSHFNTADDILKQFFIMLLGAHKVFCIEELEAPFSAETAAVFGDTKGTLKDIIIDFFYTDFSLPPTFDIYCSYNGEVYCAKGVYSLGSISLNFTEADNVAKEQYALFQAGYGVKAGRESVHSIQEKTGMIFAQEMTSKEATDNLLRALYSMPDNGVMPIERIMITECTTATEENESPCWWLLLKTLLTASILPVATHKIIWIGEIATCFSEGNCRGEAYHIIIDISRKSRQIFFKNKDQTPEGMSLEYGSLPAQEDYMPAYMHVFGYYQQHKTLDTSLEKKTEGIERRSVHQLLTPEAIAKINEAQEKKRATGNK
jgi:hypothetical protein